MTALTLLDVLMGDLRDCRLGSFETLLRKTRATGNPEQLAIVARALLERWPEHLEARNALDSAIGKGEPRLPQFLEVEGVLVAEPDTCSTITLKEVVAVGIRAWQRIRAS